LPASLFSWSKTVGSA